MYTCCTWVIIIVKHRIILVCLKPTCAISLVRMAGSHSDVKLCNESQAVELNLICVSLCILLLLFSVQISISLKTKYEIYKTKLFWASETITQKKEAEKRNKARAPSSLAATFASLRTQLNKHLSKDIANNWMSWIEPRDLPTCLFSFGHNRI